MPVWDFGSLFIVDDLLGMGEIIVLRGHVNTEGEDLEKRRPKIWIQHAVNFFENFFAVSIV